MSRLGYSVTRKIDAQAARTGRQSRVRVRKSAAEQIADAAIYGSLGLLAFIVVYPLYYMLIVSVSNGVFVMRGDVFLAPIGLNFATYQIILDDPVIARAYLNTIIYTTLGTGIALTMTALCAYPLSRRDFFGRPVYTLLVVFTMFFEGGIIPSYMIVHGLGFIDTLWAIVIPPAIIVWYMIIMRTFFQQIPAELHESAYIDGANDLRVFARIVLPISTPVIATMVLFYAVWHWNSFFPALLYLNRKARFPMQLIMRNIVVSGSMADQVEAMSGGTAIAVTGLNIKYAVIFITITPILIFYPFIQRYFVKGMLVGSLKG